MLRGCKMTVNTMEVLKDALKLSPEERAALAEQLLSSLEQPDEHIDNLWRKEAEDRIDAYNEGKIKSVSLKDVLAKYQK